jgi:hypothetical protein
VERSEGGRQAERKAEWSEGERREGKGSEGKGRGAKGSGAERSEGEHLPSTAEVGRWGAVARERKRRSMCRLRRKRAGGGARDAEALVRLAEAKVDRCLRRKRAGGGLSRDGLVRLAEAKVSMCRLRRKRANGVAHDTLAEALVRPAEARVDRQAGGCRARAQKTQALVRTAEARVCSR